MNIAKWLLVNASRRHLIGDAVAVPSTSSPLAGLSIVFAAGVALAWRQPPRS